MSAIAININNLSVLERNQLLGLMTKAKAEEDKSFWFPKHSEAYYLIDNRNAVVHSAMYHKVKGFNYYKTKEDAQKVADYYMQSEWFVKKAHEFQKETGTWFAIYLPIDQVWSTGANKYMSPEVITMDKNSAIEFIVWLNKYAPTGGLE